jgi:hypothetical protein
MIRGFGFGFGFGLGLGPWLGVRVMVRRSDWGQRQGLGFRVMVWI